MAVPVSVSTAVASTSDPHTVREQGRDRKRERESKRERENVEDIGWRVRTRGKRARDGGQQ